MDSSIDSPKDKITAGKYVFLFSETGVEILNGIKSIITILYSEIKSISFKPAIFLIPGELLIEKHNGEPFAISVKFHSMEEIQNAKTEIERICKINAFEEATFRAPFYYNISLTNAAVVVVVFSLCILQIGIGAVIIALTSIGLFVGVPIILLAMFVFVLVLKSSSGHIEGNCPICGKKTESTITTKHFFCSKCKERVTVESDYYEVK